MMAAVRRSLSLLGLACAACSAESLVYVPAPEAVPGAEAVILHIADVDGDSAVVGSSGAAALELGVSRWKGRVPAQVTLTLAYYSLTPTELGLAVGALGDLKPGETRACGLSTPLKIFQTTLYAGSPDPWQDNLRTVPERMASYIGASEVCVKPKRCLRTQATVVPLPGSNTINIILALDAQHVLAGDFGGRFWTVRKDGFVEPMPALMGLPGRTAARDPNGEYWFGGEAGRIAHGPLEGPFETQVVSTASAAVVSSIRFDPESGQGLAVVVSAVIEAPGSERVELLSQTRSGWVPIAQVQSQDVRTTFSRVRWLPGGEALVVHGGPSVLHYDGRDVHDQVVGRANLFFSLEVRDATFHPQHGAAVVADDGRLYRGAPPYDNWMPAEEALLGVPADSVLPLGDGYLIGGNVGRMKQFYPGAAECPDEDLTDSDADFMLPFGDDVVASGQTREGAESNSLTWVSFLPR